MKKLYYFFALQIILLAGMAIFITNNTSKNNHDNKSNLANKIYMPQHVTTASAIIMPSTQMIYNYYYEDDGCVESTSEIAPHFLIGMNQQELKNTFRDWQIQDFSNQKVVMQKNVSGSSQQHYIIGIKDGYIAVFYQKPINGTTLREITDTPVTSLTYEDRKRLEDGIRISGEEKLISILQDYES